MSTKNRKSKPNVQETVGKITITERLIDDLDKRILKELLADSRLSFRQIATKLQVSPNTILSRIKKMYTNGIIKFYTTVFDHEKLGYELTVIIEITVSKGKLLEMEKDIADMPTVCAVYDTTGTSDAMIVAKFKTREELSNFTKTLLSMPFVERTNTHLVLTTVKEDFRLI